MKNEKKLRRNIARHSAIIIFTGEINLLLIRERQKLKYSARSAKLVNVYRHARKRLMCQSWTASRCSRRHRKSTIWLLAIVFKIKAETRLFSASSRAKARVDADLLRGLA